jgi:hypothetical protein
LLTSLAIRVRSYTLITLLKNLVKVVRVRLSSEKALLIKRVLEAIHDNTIICRTHSMGSVWRIVRIGGMHAEVKVFFDLKVLFLG